MNNRNKVLFITRYPLENGFNLKTKFDGQMQALSRLGYDVVFWGYDKRHYYFFHDGQKVPVLRLFFTKTSLFYHILSYISLYFSVIKSVSKLDLSGGDICYIRSMPSEVVHKIMLSKIKRKGVTIITENPTYIKGGGEKPRWFIRLLMAFLRPFDKSTNIDYYTIIGDDCEGSYLGVPAINISNCISIDGIPIRTPQAHNGLNFLAVASMSDWHGYDRLIKGMANYRDENIHLYMVGGDGDGSLEKWKELSITLGLQNKVHFMGPRHGADLIELFNICDIAFASLGMYRTNCYNASVLKAREYSARGIPFIYATNDPVLDMFPMPFFFKIANDDTPVDVESVIDFYNKISSMSKIPEMMREYAKDRMSWESEFSKVISFIS